MKNLKETKIYNFFYNLFGLNKSIKEDDEGEINDEFIESMNFSHALFNNYIEPNNLLNIFNNINDESKNKCYKNMFVYKFTNEKDSFILVLNRYTDNIFEFKLFDDFINSYDISSDCFYNDIQTINTIKDNFCIEFVKYIDGYYKVIKKDTREELFCSINRLIGQNNFNVEKISFFDIYNDMKKVLKEKLIEFYNEYNNEIEKMNNNILFLNNKIVTKSSTCFNILDSYTDEDIEIDENSFSLEKYFHDNPFQNQMYINAAKSLQKEQNEYLNILDNFNQVKHILIKSFYSKMIGFLGCQNKNLGKKTIFNPLINKYEEVYLLSGDIIICNSRNQLCEIEMYYTKHTLLYFSVKSKSKEEVDNIFETGINNYYKNFRIQKSFKDF